MEQGAGEPRGRVRRRAESDLGGRRGGNDLRSSQQAIRSELRSWIAGARRVALPSVMLGVAVNRLWRTVGGALSARPHAARAWSAKLGWVAGTPSIPPRCARWSARRHTAAAANWVFLFKHVLDKHSPHTSAASLSLGRRPARPCLKDQADGSATPAPTAPLPPHWSERPAVLSAQTARMTGTALRPRPIQRPIMGIMGRTSLGCHRRLHGIRCAAVRPARDGTTRPRCAPRGHSVCAPRPRRRRSVSIWNLRLDTQFQTI